MMRFMISSVKTVPFPELAPAILKYLANCSESIISGTWVAVEKRTSPE